MARGTETEGLVVADVDLEHSRYAREGWRFFDSRRPDQYAKILEL
jgi:predicted amidohydrolase